MLKNENIICISSIDWDFIWQGHQEIMSTLAENYNRVLFIENTGIRPPGIKDISRIKNRIKNWFLGVRGIRKERENLYVFSPIVLPFPYSKIARWFNARLVLSILNKWMRVMNFNNPIVWIFLPSGFSLDLMDRLDKKATIYYCLDNFKKISNFTKKAKKTEVDLIKKSDVVFVTSEELYKYCSLYTKDLYKFPFTVNMRKFDKEILDKKKPPEDIKNIKKPIIGFSGGVRGIIDIEMIKYAAGSNPDCSFVFVGPLQSSVQSLKKFKNIHFLGQKKHDELPLYINYFDIAMIPYILNEFTRCIYPAKLNEYLALGKPVISTQLPELSGISDNVEDIVFTVRDKNDFSAKLKEILNKENADKARKRIEFAASRDWNSHIEQMSRIIYDKIQSKDNNDAVWKEKFVYLLRSARRRFFKVVGGIALLYLLFFKTPFLWLLAEPLKIENHPAKSDAIIVFGGGVGETGSPGKSTIERARYAAELYKEGYADKIIFSSGYAYRHNDAENMKIFAVSLGVPSEDIILEQKANSAYENVIFSKQIIDKEKWDKILLVTSPYNMLRVKLVCDKVAKGKEIIYAPVPDSQFYDKAEGVRSEQIKAILHEYAGIVYYFFKGYII
jgi:uncharacterized SAM-binding protein YcdF (DUF218 family)/glycosyltransferase involved in cell wall biosynthesis